MSKNQDNIIFLESSDELTTVLDGVLNSEGTVVHVVIGPNVSIANNILNLRLLKREAESVGKHVIIVTKNIHVKNIAERAGLKVQNDTPLVKAKQHKPAKYDVSSRKLITDIIAPPRGAAKAEYLPGSFKPAAEDFQDKSFSEKLSPLSDITSGRKSSLREKIKESLSPLQRSGEAILRSKDYMGEGRRNFASISFARIFSFSILKFAARSPKRTFVVVSSALALAVIFFVVLTILPRVTLNISPQSVEDTLSFTLVFDANITSTDFQRNIVPAQILEEKGERTVQYDASGTAQVSESATGIIRIFNEFSSSPQTLVANTRFLSSDGKLFRTTETVVVPGAKIDDGKIIASSVTVQARAAEPGADFNIGPSTFSIPGFKGTPKFLSFFGRSEEAMSGGFSGVRAVATDGDKTRAREDLQTNLLGQLSDELRNKIPENLIVIEESFSKELTKFDINTENIAGSNKFTVDAEGEAKVFLIDKKDIESAIQHNFSTSSKFQNFELSPTRTITYIVKETDFTKGSARVTVNVLQIFNRVVDMDMLKDEIRGKNEVEVRKILAAREELASAQVRFWPFWVHSVPKDRNDITVEINKR